MVYTRNAEGVELALISATPKFRLLPSVQTYFMNDLDVFSIQCVAYFPFDPCNTAYLFKSCKVS